MSDPIADMLTRMRNALAVSKKDIVLPMSKIKYTIASILERDRWVEKIEIIKGGKEKEGDQKFDQLRIILKYKHKKPVITSLKRISKPGIRVYVKKNEISQVLNGLGISIISTPSGLMTNKEARKKGLGGEVICEIY